MIHMRAIYKTPMVILLNVRYENDSTVWSKALAIISARVVLWKAYKVTMASTIVKTTSHPPGLHLGSTNLNRSVLPLAFAQREGYHMSWLLLRFTRNCRW